MSQPSGRPVIPGGQKYVCLPRPLRLLVFSGMLTDFATSLGHFHEILIPGRPCEYSAQSDSFLPLPAAQTLFTAENLLGAEKPVTCVSEPGHYITV